MISTLLLFWSKLYKLSHFRNVAVEEHFSKIARKTTDNPRIKSGFNCRRLENCENNHFLAMYT